MSESVGEPFSMKESGRKHAEAIALLLEAVTDNSAEELRTRNQIHEHQKQIDRLGGDYPSASAQASILMDQARKDLAERQEIVTSLMASVTTLVLDRKREESE